MQKNSYFHDPVHGHIYLSPIERSVVDTLEFQRLRFIRQNSLMHYVFPGAFHTRFSHSIGVCHNAYRLIKQLIFWRRDQYNNYALQVLRLACLLHDIGHGAFSHTLAYVKVNGRSFLPTLNEVLKQPSEWNLHHHNDDAIKLGIKEFFKDEEDHPIEHEALSVLIIKKIFHILSDGTKEYSGTELLMGVPENTWAQDVASLILNTIPPSSLFIEEANKLIIDHLEEIPTITKNTYDSKSKGEELIQIFSSLVSGTIDADRMDYMIRDSQSCGVNYGLFDDVGLISALNLIIDDSGKLRLGLNAKRTNTLDDYLWSRYQMFKQIYCHKTQNAYNVLLNLAMDDLASNGQLSMPTSLNQYLKLTDDYIMSRVFEYAQDHPDKHTWVQAFAKRKLPKLLGIFEASHSDEVWQKTNHQIYKESTFEKYPGWETDKNFITVSQKAEVVRATKDSSTLPVVYSNDKAQGSYIQKSYLQQSVFFNSNLETHLRLKELHDRLNRKLVYFYKL